MDELLIGAAVSVTVVTAIWAGLFVSAHLMPPGRAHDLVAFAPNCVMLLTRLRKDSRLPWRGRLALGTAVAYIVSPIQLIPNVIPVIGQADDFIVLAAALRYACRHLPGEDVRAAWPGSSAHLDRLLVTPTPVQAVPVPAVEHTSGDGGVDSVA